MPAARPRGRKDSSGPRKHLCQGPRGQAWQAGSFGPRRQAPRGRAWRHPHPASPCTLHSNATRVNMSSCPRGPAGLPSAAQGAGGRRRTGLQRPGSQHFPARSVHPLPHGTPHWASGGSQPFHEVSATSPQPPKTSNKRTFANFPLRSLSDFLNRDPISSLRLVN